MSSRKCSAFVQKSEPPKSAQQGGLTLYTEKEVLEHDKIEKRMWVTLNDGVYDITDYINVHPGGREITMAAGRALEPCWKLYPVHQKENVSKILEELRIGTLRDEGAARTSLVDMEDPYWNEPIRQDQLIPICDKPYNAGAAPGRLVDNFITPNDLFFIRSHTPVPDIDVKTYRLKVEKENSSDSLTFTFDELKNMPKHTIVATIICAGHRRIEMVKVKPLQGMPWDHSAMCNASWTGVKLCHVLKLANITKENPGYNHIHFEAYSYGDAGNPYAASIPTWRAVDPLCDALIAYEMNGVPMNRDHGFPVRVIIPAIGGCRSVKWLEKIIARQEENKSFWYTHLYKHFPTYVTTETADYKTGPVIQECPVTSAICQPSDGDRVKVVDGCIVVKGYAWSGNGQKIYRLDVTIDAGKNWQTAEIDHQDGAIHPWHWTWTIWSIKMKLPPNATTVEIWAKATDSCYNTQPETIENIWNLKGCLVHAYHRVKVTLDY